MTPTVRVSVDPDLCMGNEECIRAAPDAFVLDADAIAHPTEQAPMSSLEELREAARRCPVQAVRVTVSE